VKIPRRGTIDSWVEKIASICNGQLELTENIRSMTVDATAPGVADTDFTVEHNLGKVPTAFIANLSVAGFVYVQSRTQWNTQTMVVRCSVPSATVRFVVF
jgi:hypothetical protein